MKKKKFPTIYVDVIKNKNYDTKSLKTCDDMSCDFLISNHNRFTPWISFKSLFIVFVMHKLTRNIHDEGVCYLLMILS